MSHELFALLAESFEQTLVMVGVALAISTAAGIPLGVILHATAPRQLLPNAAIYRILGTVVNATRSTPFIILMVALIPLTRVIVGTSIGTPAAIVPLTIAATPFIARIVEAALRDVDQGLVEAAQAMGATPLQIVAKVLLPEALPAVVAGLTLAAVAMIGYSAMAGAVGGGGLGDLAIRYGYERFRVDVMAATVAILIALVQFVQSGGDILVRRIRHA
ncbi:ABC transporter permease [bacterium]|nr:MAG: ABC transporter permease [bacterium]